jgi:hypothetical protein
VPLAKLLEYKTPTKWYFEKLLYSGLTKKFINCGLASGKLGQIIIINHDCPARDKLRPKET